MTALRRAVRDTDVMGWYLEDRIVGVVMPDGGSVQQPDACSTILKRVSAALDAQLPRRLARHVRFRVHCVCRSPANHATDFHLDH
jgi:hypothetical protein